MRVSKKGRYAKLCRRDKVLYKSIVGNVPFIYLFAWACVFGNRLSAVCQHIRVKTVH